MAIPANVPGTTVRYSVYRLLAFTEAFSVLSLPPILYLIADGSARESDNVHEASPSLTSSLARHLFDLLSLRTLWDRPRIAEGTSRGDQIRLHIVGDMQPQQRILPKLQGTA